MNRDHLELCSSDGWRDVLRDLIIPYALRDARLGDDVLEVGPGPGMTTDLLRRDLVKLTELELDEGLASALAARMAGTDVEVVQGNATVMPFDDDRFSGAVSFTMLHHVPTAGLQDRLFSEVARVLRPGGLFVVSDSVASAELAALQTTTSTTPSIVRRSVAASTSPGSRRPRSGRTTSGGRRTPPFEQLGRSVRSGPTRCQVRDDSLPSRSPAAPRTTLHPG
jgi:SAM-dependent methyltransferase